MKETLKREGKLFAARSHGFSCSGPTSGAPPPLSERWKGEMVLQANHKSQPPTAQENQRRDTFRHSRRQPTLTFMPTGKPTCSKCVMFCAATCRNGLWPTPHPPHISCYCSEFSTFLCLFQCQWKSYKVGNLLFHMNKIKIDLCWENFICCDHCLPWLEEQIHIDRHKRTMLTQRHLCISNSPKSFELLYFK